MGKYTVYSLDGCPYSMKAEELFKKSKASYDIVKVFHHNKNSFKQDMNTFPQIYYSRNRNGTTEKTLVGGLSNLQDIIKTNIPHNKTGIEYVLFKSIKRNFHHKKE